MPNLYDPTVMLQHGKVKLALHLLRDASGRPLLLLHGLGSHSPATVPGWADAWPGPIHALDFTGHGASTRPRGGGYTAELLMADVDTALARLGPVTLVGRGLGAYVALLTAGGRPELVRGAVLADGGGLAGGPTTPPSPYIAVAPERAKHPGEPDPYAILELSRDLRPADYAATFARRAIDRSTMDPPLIVTTRWYPAWLEATIDLAGVEKRSLPDALALYAQRT